MKITFATTMILSFVITFSCAQNAHFVKGGNIEFEKRVNTFAILQKHFGNSSGDYMQQAFDQYKKNQPQFRTATGVLKFNLSKSIFAALDPDAVSPNTFGVPMMDQPNIVYTDFPTGSSVIQKKVFEETFLLKDSTRKINWKITDETREIAGYVCRRANAIILDSVYVVAFYTNQIPISGGPESFGGLPGMILQVALPHENITWKAIKITEADVDPTAITPPKKGKPINRKDLNVTLNKALQNWGDEKPYYLRFFSF